MSDLHVDHVVRDPLARRVQLLCDVHAARAEQRRDLAEHSGVVLVDDAQPRVRRVLLLLFIYLLLYLTTTTTTTIMIT